MFVKWYKHTAFFEKYCDFFISIVMMYDGNIEYIFFTPFFNPV